MQEQTYISEKRKFQVEEVILIFLLVLSLPTILDSLSLDWHFSLAGLFLGSSTAVGTFYKKLLWTDIAIGIVVASFLWEYELHKRANT